MNEQQQKISKAYKHLMSTDFNKQSAMIAASELLKLTSKRSKAAKKVVDQQWNCVLAGGCHNYLVSLCIDLCHNYLNTKERSGA